jgi:dihydrofolate synthase / folylpolyglutamate synthase
MNYQQTIDYLFSRLPMFSRIGAAAYKADLTNTIRLCDFLENPQTKFKTIHIAGTNGKGSVSHMLAAILQTAGYKTGLYTSPHLKDFRERIKVNLPDRQAGGDMVNEDFIIDFTEKINPLIGEIDPSFFEITVAMAFEYFAEQKVDIAVIEVGLGGRLDSTNIILPELSVITNIGWDHMNLLGDSLEQIAFEKAGIIKHEIPAVIGEVLPETLPVFEKIANEKNSPLSIASQKRNVVDWHWEKNELIVDVAEVKHTDHKTWHLDLQGIYQTKNLLTVLETCSQLKQLNWKLDDEIIYKGIKHAKRLTGLHGRWEIIHHSPLVVLDVAHNIEGIRQLVQQVELTEHRQLHIIKGMVKDKETEKILAILPKEAIYYFTKAQIPRALPENELAEKAKHAGLSGFTFPNVNDALKSALQHAHPDDMIIVSGSVYLVGEVNAPIP